LVSTRACLHALCSSPCTVFLEPFADPPLFSIHPCSTQFQNSLTTGVFHSGVEILGKGKGTGGNTKLFSPRAVCQGFPSLRVTCISRRSKSCLFLPFCNIAATKNSTLVDTNTTLQESSVSSLVSDPQESSSSKHWTQRIEHPKSSFFLLFGNWNRDTESVFFFFF